ncbi:hypothetical protein KFE25_007228 [Diacronema lutheri]|uniref:Uncharacterized protein n=1 Tax=Diacronema lutheri TaxID=2081491 RepID=A0A8J5X111_DIALT|nr:hypothetical protein KFE25_007228 [Diacronema lutheri]
MMWSHERRAGSARASAARPPSAAALIKGLGNRGCVYAVHRAARSPSLLAFVFVVGATLGSSMLHPLLGEAHARRHGIWYAVTCEINAKLLVAELENLEQFATADAEYSTGKQRWRFVAAYNVTVAIGEGCDPAAPAPPRSARHSEAELRRERAEAVGGFYVEAGRRLAAVTSASSATRDAFTTAQPATLAMRARRRLRELAARALDGRRRALADASTPMRHAARAACAPALGARGGGAGAVAPHRLGHHVAFYRLRRAQEDFCNGPADAPEPVARRACASRTREWFTHALEPGAAVPCWLFEKRRPGSGASELRVVIDRELPPHLSFYVAYLLLLAALGAHLAVLVARRWLQRSGLVEPDRVPEASAARDAGGSRAAAAMLRASMRASEAEAEPMAPHARSMAAAATADGAAAPTDARPACPSAHARQQRQQRHQPTQGHAWHGAPRAAPVLTQRGGSYGRVILRGTAAPRPPPPPSFVRSPADWLRRALLPSRELVEWRGRRDTLSDPHGPERPDKLIMLI